MTTITLYGCRVSADDTADTYTSWSPDREAIARLVAIRPDRVLVSRRAAPAEILPLERHLPTTTGSVVKVAGGNRPAFTAVLQDDGAWALSTCIRGSWFCTSNDLHEEDWALVIDEGAAA